MPRKTENRFNPKALVELFLKQSKELDNIPYYSRKLDDVPCVSEIMALPPNHLCELVVKAFKIDTNHYKEDFVLDQLRDRLYRRKLSYTPRQIEELCQLIVVGTGRYYCGGSKLVHIVERYSKDNELTDKASAMIQKAFDGIDISNDDLRKRKTRLRKILGLPREPIIVPGEAWSNAAMSELSKIRGKKKQALWNELLAHCQDSEGGKPNKKWTDTSTNLIKSIGTEPFLTRILQWFLLVGQPRTQVVEFEDEIYRYTDQSLDPTNTAILKGLVWCCSLHYTEETVRAITQLAITAYKKIPGIGPRAVALGNACVYALGQIEGTQGVAQLAILKVKVKFRTAQKGIEKSLSATAERVGIPREELEEMSVPAYGLEEVGMWSEQLGDYTVKLVTAGRKPEIQWFREDGTQQKTIPKAIKDNFTEEIKELKQTAKDIEKMLPAQSARIEQFYLEQAERPYLVWKERYLQHPLVGVHARRLIWNVKRGKKQATVIWSNGELVNHLGKPVEWLDEKTLVSLWHPLDEKNIKRVTAWRDWLFEHEVSQPFKQAYREVYIITDAEKNTETYSNRFAAHVLKQHQFNALCANRGWKNTLRLMVDDEFPPAHLLLPKWNLRAEFWVEGAGTEFGDDTNEVGTFYYLTTDQVRFYNQEAATNYAHASGGRYASIGTDRDENHPLHLSEIPALVLSEVMRDVDLFVGVASVGNDPNWHDGGAEGNYRDYWQSYSFGELNATASTRKSVLERLIPRLKIADRCSISDRFLIVQGDIRTYRIHLGSGNILMEPNDQYLCIVPKQTTSKKSGSIFLPFEGDRTISIILSKALLLADDTKIKDRTIVSQIKR